MAKKKRDYDFSIHALRVVEEATKDKETIEVETVEIEGKNPNAVALGRLGGLKGGKARANKLTPEQRKEIAQKAAQKRWGKKP
ncbi:MAG: histone H1 [Dehalococcoidia bacterium]